MDGITWPSQRSDGKGANERHGGDQESGSGRATHENLLISPFLLSPRKPFPPPIPLFPKADQSWLEGPIKGEVEVMGGKKGRGMRG